MLRYEETTQGGVASIQVCEITWGGSSSASGRPNGSISDPGATGGLKEKVLATTTNKTQTSSSFLVATYAGCLRSLELRKINVVTRVMPSRGTGSTHHLSGADKVRKSKVVLFCLGETRHRNVEMSTSDSAGL